jgi:hypothetical protein
MTDMCAASFAAAAEAAATAVAETSHCTPCTEPTAASLACCQSSWRRSTLSVPRDVRRRQCVGQRTCVRLSSAERAVTASRQITTLSDELPKNYLSHRRRRHRNKRLFHYSRRPVHVAAVLSCDACIKILLNVDRCHRRVSQ